MNIFTIFFYQILAKYSPKRTKLHHFYIFWGGACLQILLTNAQLSRAAWREITPLLQKYFNPPPPPPRNEILDTPLPIASAGCDTSIIFYVRNEHFKPKYPPKLEYLVLFF